MLKKLCYVFLAGFSLSAIAGNVKLVENGVSKITIVVSDPTNPARKMAGEELARHIELRTGAKVAVVPEGTSCKPGTIPFYLGLSEKTRSLGAKESELKTEGHLVKVTPQYIYIAGKDDPQKLDPLAGHHFVYGNKKYGIYDIGEHGTLHGVYKFLEKWAGIRWYMPGDLGTIVPKSRDFVVPEGSYQDAPAYPSRRFASMYFEEASKDNLYWYRRICAGTPAPRIYLNHNYQEIFHKYRKTKPEFFALIDGKRDLSNLSTANPFGNLCFSHPELPKAFAELARNFFKSRPDHTVYPVVPQDGMFRICECENCKKLYSPELGENGKFSNAVFTLAANVARELAKTHPDKKIGVLAYERHRMAPTFQLPSNIHVRICYERQDMRDPKKKAEIRKTIADLRKRGATVSVWTYPLYNHIPPMRGIPIFYPEILKEDILFNYKHGVREELSQGGFCAGGGDQYVHCSDMAFMGVNHLNNYFRTRLLWNPNLNLEAELSEYYKLFYGPAADKMRTFWETAERLYCKGAEKNPMRQYTADDIRKLYALLNDAAKAAPKGSNEAKRIAMIKADMDPFLIPMMAQLDYKPIFSVPMVKEEISFSDEKLWKYAGYYPLLRRDGRSVDPRFATSVKVLGNKKGIALKIAGGEPEPEKIYKKTTKRDDGATWLDDSIEIYLCTADRKVNLLYIITAGNNIYDRRLDIDPNKPGDFGWSGKIKFKAWQTGKMIGWDVFIPWEDLGKDVKLEGMKFQIYRRRTGGNPKFGDYYSIQPVLMNRNYSPDSFPEMQIMTTGSLLYNGSFEEISNGTPVGWSQRGYIFNGNDAAKSSDGKNSVTVLKDNKRNVKKDWIASRKFPVKGGTDYALHFDYLGYSGVAYVLFSDAAGKNVPEPNRVCFDVPGKKVWLTKNCFGRVPEKAVSAYVAFRSFEASKEGVGLTVDNVKFFGTAPDNPKR